MILNDLHKKGLIKPPKWLIDNCAYLTIMGSNAYGVSNDSSDFDIYGFCIPPKKVVFPHLDGEIIGFGRQSKRFGQWQEHHIVDKQALGGKGREYDFSVYSIVKYFSLAMENNPNMIDSLFTPERCVLHCTKIGNMVRENRKLFLHKGAWQKFKGYSHSQLHKMNSKKPEGKRKAGVEKYGYDLKFAYHIIRLLGEVEQILTEGDIDLQRDREQLKSIRRGEWTKDQICGYFDQKKLDLETIYSNSKLRLVPDEQAIKQLLMNCLEEHYGNIQDCVIDQDAATVALREIQEVIYRNAKILG